VNSELKRAADAVRVALDDADRGLVDRRVVVELAALAAVAGEHLLVLGPPGTGKSEAVRRVARALGGRYFEYLLGRFTEPSEIFGPVDLRKLRDGVVEIETAGMLPEAEVAFLDEVFLGSTAILNTLLGLLNERVFRRGHTERSVPLRLCVGAANALPADGSLAAFADRFLVRCFVEPVDDAHLEELLTAGWRAGQSPVARIASVADLDRLAAAARAADVAPVRPHLARAIRTLRDAGITLSDRRVVNMQKLVTAAAALAGRERPTAADLWPIVYAVPTPDGQGQARDVLRDLVAEADNGALAAAAEDASASPASRAARLVAAAEGLLSRAGGDGDRVALRLELEALAREIDAGFAKEELPPTLRETRDRIVSALDVDA
jgi:MoxR-like ATPase